jgi:KUP system potassium uptake protein
VKLANTSFYLGRETLIATSGAKPARRSARPKNGALPEGRRMGRLRKKLFILMTRNSQSATAYFGLPANRVVELGAQIQF